MIILITSLIGLWGYGQEKDSTLIQELLSQSWELALEDINGAEVRALQALNIAEENDDADGIYTCYKNLIHIFFFVGNSQRSLEYCDKALKVEAMDNERGLFYIYRLKGLNYAIIGDYNAAIKNYFKVVEVHAEKGEIEGYIGIGFVYSQMEQPRNAIPYYKDALKAAQEKDDQANVAYIAGQLGYCYSKLNEYQPCERYYAMAKEAFEIIEPEYNFERVDYLTNLSKYLIKRRRLKKATIASKKALRIAFEHQTVRLMPQIFNTLGAIHLHSQQLDSARHYFHKSLAFLEKNRDITTEIDTHKHLTDLFEATKEYQSALQASKQYIRLNDSVVNSNNTKIVTTLSERYKNEKKDKELLLHRAKIDELEIIAIKKERTYAITVVLLMLNGLVFLLYKNHKIKRAKELAQTYSEAKSKVINVISHEMRTPLFSILGNSNLLLNQKHQLANKESQNNLRDISFAAEYLNSLVDNALLNSNIENTISEEEQQKYKNEKFKLREVVHKSSKLGMLFDHGNELIIKIHDHLPNSFYGPKTEITQILRNLSNNANKFTKKGKIEVSVTGDKVDNGQWLLRFVVADTGIGISDHEKNRVFDKHYTGMAHRSNTYLGLGLGLYLVKKLLADHHSLPYLDSTENLGTRIRFDLKLKQVVDSDMTSAEADRILGSLERILLVDDSVVNQKLICKMLSKITPAKCDVANNGALAVGRYESQSYDIVLMDIFMPIMDGFQATEKIKSIDPDANIVAISSISKEEFEKKKGRDHFLGMISKPIKVEPLKEELADFLRDSILAS